MRLSPGTLRDPSKIAMALNKQSSLLGLTVCSRLQRHTIATPAAVVVQEILSDMLLEKDEESACWYFQLAKNNTITCKVTDKRQRSNIRPGKGRFMELEAIMGGRRIFDTVVFGSFRIPVRPFPLSVIQSVNYVIDVYARAVSFPPMALPSK